ncbi:gamma-glutamyltransferase family protein [Pararobbsia alpina]|uniref:gamma-glutamyltransferase family protein n=1 Tax=Pararobbsia alpina TaxID=621374 RepID=UPI0039A53F04
MRGLRATGATSSTRHTALKVTLASFVALGVAGLATPTWAKDKDTDKHTDASTELRDNAVAVPDKYAADAAAKIFAEGGNAVDAGVAIAFSLAVTYPDAGNLGGGGFMTLVVDHKPYFLDYRETAPIAATRNMYLDANGNVIDKASLVGTRAVGVPGTVEGMWEAQRRFGKLKWSQVLEPAIDYADKGFVVDARLAKERSAAADIFKGRTNFDAYFSGLTEGATFRQPELAQTLKRIASDGGKEFYTGKTGELIATSMRGHGLITQADLSSYKAVWRQPLVGNWRGYQVITAPPPSSGGVILLQMLKMREDLESKFQGVDLNSAQYVHLVSEMEKRVFADRAAYLGDPDFVKNPTARLTDDAYLARRAMEVNADAISDTKSVKPGLDQGASAGGASGASSASNASAASGASAAQGGTAASDGKSASSSAQANAPSASSDAHNASSTDEAQPASSASSSEGTQPAAASATVGGEKPQTTHFSVVDKWGNAISNTYTLNGPFGAGVVVDKTGIVLNDEMDDFSAKPNAPNQFGVVGTEANAIASRKRPLSSMCPTILLDAQNKVAMVIGTPGGSRIPTTVYQVLTNVYDYKLPLPEAVAAQRFHHQLLPANTIYEERGKPLPDALKAELTKRGYTIAEQGFNGDIQAIRVVDGKPEPVGDPRGSGLGRTIP